MVTVVFCIACLLFQDKKAHLSQLNDKCVGSSTRCSVTIAEIKLGIACAQPAHPDTAFLFCEAMGYLAYDSAVCDKIASAGGIPVIAQLLACFPDEEGVVMWACDALFYLAYYGSASIKSSVLAQPGIISELRAAGPRLQAWGRYDGATDALKQLGV